MRFLTLCWLLAVQLLSLPTTQVAAESQVHDKSFSPTYVIHVTATTISINCESRYSVVINGTSPGPTLYMREGQTTWVRVYNDMEDQNTTMHWHGLSQRTAPFSDGTPQVAQWPIPPKNFFDYEVRPEVGDAGSYFYHSHVGFQAVSAHGALIVEEANLNPPYQYDGDVPLMLADYYNFTDAYAEQKLLGSPFVWPGETKALMVNGKSGSAGGVGSKSCNLEVISVSPGKTYRLRFIGASALTHFTMGIQNHTNLPIIEADGKYTKPFSVDHMQVAPGQRFSVLFKAKTTQELQALGKSTFWIQMENRAALSNVTNYAVLQYNVANNSIPATIPKQKPITLPQKIYDWVEYSLQALNASADPFPTAAQVNRTVTIVVVNNITGPFTPPAGPFTGPDRYSQNGETFAESKIPVPLLVKIYQQGQSAIPNYAAALKNGGWDPATYAFPAKIGEVIDIVWQGTTGHAGAWESHPFHAHGGHYFDLGGGPGNYSAADNEKRLQKYTPVLRDTTLAYAYDDGQGTYTASGWRAWRIRVDKPGAWMMHCHLLQHMIMGMQTAWVFGNASEIVGAYPEPYVTGYLNYGGSAYGNATTDPVVQHYFAGS